MREHDRFGHMSLTMLDGLEHCAAILAKIPISILDARCEGNELCNSLLKCIFQSAMLCARVHSYISIRYLNSRTEGKQDLARSSQDRWCLLSLWLYGQSSFFAIPLPNCPFPLLHFAASIVGGSLGSTPSTFRPSSI